MPLFSGIIVMVKNRTLYFVGNLSSNKNPNLSKIVIGLKNLIKKTRNLDDLGFYKVVI